MTGLKLGYELVRPMVARLETDLEDETINAAEALAKRADFEWPVNRSPRAVAASAIYLQSIRCNDKVTQREITDCCDVCDVTIRDTYHELIEHIEGLELAGQDDEPDESRWGTLYETASGWLGEQA